MIAIAFLSLLAGMLSALAPCVLPFLPIIVGGSLNAEGGRKRPFIVAGSLIVSLLIFTLLLKATTLLINIDPQVWAIGSGLLVIALGIVMLFPDLWANIMFWTKLDNKSHAILDSARNNRSSTWSAILTGAALGPVFSSCNPTYAWVIATVLPSSPLVGLFYLTMYCIGLAVVLLAVSILGRKLVQKLGWAVNPKGWFQRTLAVLFILVGVLVLTGFDKKVEAWAIKQFPSISRVEEKPLPSEDNKDSAVSVDGAFQQAPELEGIQAWVNTEPLKLKDLKGKVVLIDFWTYSCINCQRTQPYLNDWYRKYHDKGLEIVGVHAPEFAFEKNLGNVQKAVKEAEIKYPVALDNNFATWKAYQNQYWPAKYLIDKEGNIRYTHFGEGEYDETEKMIQELLKVSAPKTKVADSSSESSVRQSPETYLGLERANGYFGEPLLALGKQQYQPATELPLHGWTLAGDWEADGEKITAKSAGATLKYRFTGKEVFLVLGSDKPAELEVTVDGSKQTGGKDVQAGKVTVSDYRLYRLVSLPQPSTGKTVTIKFPAGVSANAFTFG